MTVSGLDLWQWRIKAIALANFFDVPINEVDWLLQELAGLDSLSLRLQTFKEQEKINLSISLDELNQLWQRRVNEKIPIQYLAGITPWRDFSLVVSPAVLIPRPETEMLVDLAVSGAKKAGLAQGIWVDLGTGSGAIAIGLARCLKEASIYAVDDSEAAVAIAQKNVDLLQLNQQIKLHRGSWWEPLNHLQGKIAGMVSNPPYIPTHLISTLQPEVVNHEPHLALDGGDDGLASIRYLVETAPSYLQPGGLWLVEMMAGQGEIVQAMLEQQGSYSDINLIKDLAGIDRFAIAFLA